MQGRQAICTQPGGTHCPDDPMNILEIAIRPTSLCMRLFGNVLGAFVIMELIKLVVPAFVPAIFSLYFDLFDGLIQTYVFVFLTSCS